MNKKGFTIIELITTFVLSSVIIIILINIVLVLKDTYSKTNVRTELLINQSNLSNALNTKINSDNLDSYTFCEDTEFCYVFNFVDGSSKKLKISNDTISFGSFVYKLVNGSKIENPTFDKQHIETSDTTVNNSFLIIKIPILNKLYPNEDFGINLIYPYNSNTIDL